MFDDRSSPVADSGSEPDDDDLQQFNARDVLHDEWPDEWHDIVHFEQSLVPFYGRYAQRPRNWGEVLSCQRALRPFICRYAQIAGKWRLPRICPWHSQIWHINVLQEAIKADWQKDHCGGVPPDLVEEVATPSNAVTHPLGHTWIWPEGTLMWYEQHQDQMWREINQQIIEMNQYTPPNHDHLSVEESEPHDISAILDSIIARNPELYLWWLTCVGYAYYIPEAQSKTWDDWCTWIAPTTYEGWCRLKFPSKMPMERERRHLLPLSRPRPAISFDEASKGHMAWTTSCKASFNEPIRGLLRTPDLEQGKLFLPAIGKDSQYSASSKEIELHALISHGERHEFKSETSR